MSNKRTRWRLWHLACRSSRVCPANAHSAIIYGERRSIFIDQVCCNDANNNGACWCGKLQRAAVGQVVTPATPEPGETK